MPEVIIINESLRTEYPLGNADANEPLTETT